MAFYVDPGAAFAGDQGASTVNGQLQRSQWEDWKARFQPKISELARIAENPTFTTEQGTDAAAAVNTSYQNSQANLATQRKGMGLQLTPAQQAAEQRKMAIGNAADGVTAYNSAKIAAKDLQSQIMAGSGGLTTMPGTGAQ
jgi:hypothetical protein